MESIAYPINVNTWQKKIITPKVQLWSPQNGSIIQSNFIELSWMLENWNLPNVTYDIYLDTVDPPVAINRSGLINTTIIVNDLIDGMTYYWTVIPRIGIINGSCLSGVWSFTLDIPIPSVTLISPANGSEVQALRPTFVWTTDYDGTEELTYNIYLGKQEPLDTEILDYDDISHLSKNVLEYNETYYWKVMPKAGGLEGIESETWWFTVRPKDYEPTFGIELLLEPSIIEIKPGETKYVHATVTNVGEINDNIVLSILELPVLGLDIEINEPKMIQVEPSGTAVFNITISAKEDAKEDTKMITVVAASGNAAEHEQVLEKKATLFVKISSLDTHDTGRSTGINEYWILLIIIIVIIIILSFVGLILKKKQEPKGELPPEEASTPEHEPKVEAPQTPENTPEIVTTTSETTPTIDSTEPESKTIDTPMPGQIPQPQIPETTQQPQLPPADIETKDETSGESNEETRQPVEDPSTPPNQE